jgi:hypothetical protein
MAAVVAVAFVLFGGASSQLNNAIARAATVSASAPGYKMQMTIDMSSPALNVPITASGTGVMDLRDHAASMSFAFDFSQLPQAAQALGTGTMQMGMVMDGSVLYMKFPDALTARIPSLGGKPWVKMDLGKLIGLPGLSSLGNPTMSDPSQMLQYLRAASDSVSDEGRQQVDGVPTTHYRADLSLDRLPANSPSIRNALSKLQQATGLHDVPLDVWIDAHHLVRRIGMSVDFSPPTGPPLTETITEDLTDYGPQPRPTPPPADQVQDLSGLVGGAAGIGGGLG